ncbi:hypothetical protein CYMTET_30144 [Cymbomonas tetramitiformis]|uniref:Uncharacterized protein n=1 Tax=Cymbomonas tetramitiformis TaxID=36881 RepID=A0AAE0FK22_9CHLO|nr:hypothetical protein CYMTET_30144 [Cymbomonas tetramitiformis]
MEASLESPGYQAALKGEYCEYKATVVERDIEESIKRQLLSNQKIKDEVQRSKRDGTAAEVDQDNDDDTDEHWNRKLDWRQQGAARRDDSRGSSDEEEDVDPQKKVHDAKAEYERAKKAAAERIEEAKRQASERANKEKKGIRTYAHPASVACTWGLEAPDEIDTCNKGPKS